MAASTHDSTTRISPPNVKRQTRAFERENRECAEIILRESHLYDPGMIRWAELFMERLEERKCQVGPQKTLPLTTLG